LGNQAYAEAMAHKNCMIGALQGGAGPHEEHDRILEPCGEVEDGGGVPLNQRTAECPQTSKTRKFQQ
jgi:hypothetical protein